MYSYNCLMPSRLSLWEHVFYRRQIKRIWSCHESFHGKISILHWKWEACHLFTGSWGVANISFKWIRKGTIFTQAVSEVVGTRSSIAYRLRTSVNNNYLQDEDSTEGLHYFYSRKIIVDPIKLHQIYSFW
jgi:hypothetical protein